MAWKFCFEIYWPLSSGLIGEFAINKGFEPYFMILCWFYFFFQLFPIHSLQTPRNQYVSNFKLSFLHTNWKGWHDACQSRIKIVVLTPQDSKTSGNITCMLWPSSRLRQLLSQVWHVFVKIAVNYRSWATKSRMYKNIRFPFIIPANEL